MTLIETPPALAGGQPYPYTRTELVEPDWTRFPGWREVTEEQWRSAQWQRAHCVKNLRQLRELMGDLVDEAFYADLERDQRERATMSMLVPLEVGVERLVEQVAHQGAQLPDVLHAVGALPLRAAPLLVGHVAPARQPAPVGLDELDPAVAVGLTVGVDRGRARQHLGHARQCNEHLPVCRACHRRISCPTLVA